MLYPLWLRKLVCKYTRHEMIQFEAGHAQVCVCCGIKQCLDGCPIDVDPIVADRRNIVRKVLRCSLCNKDWDAELHRKRYAYLMEKWETADQTTHLAWFQKIWEEML